MAENKDKNYSNADKLDYYKKRAMDANLTESQRNFAIKRIASLTAPKTPTQQTSKPRNNNYSGQKTFTVTVRPGK